MKDKREQMEKKTCKKQTIQQEENLKKKKQPITDIFRGIEIDVTSIKQVQDAIKRKL